MPKGRTKVARTSAVVSRRSLYLRELQHLLRDGQATVSSSQLGRLLGFSDAQVRKDLAYFGQFGRPGVGYGVAELADRLRHILRTDRLWKVVLVGAGDLGRALLRHRSFRRKGFELVAAFDAAEGVIGTTVGQVTVRPMRELPAVVAEHDAKLAVLAVPPEAAQEATNALCEAGIKGILNFAPASLSTPSGVTVRPVDLSAELEQLTYSVGGEPD